MNTLTFVIGSGFVSTLIFFPIAYYALTGQFKFKFSSSKIAWLFFLSIPLVGVLQAILGGGNSESLFGWFVLFVIPLAACLTVIFATYRLSLTHPEEPRGGGIAAAINAPLNTPQKRVAFLLIWVGVLVMLFSMVFCPYTLSTFIYLAIQKPVIGMGASYGSYIIVFWIGFIVAIAGAVSAYAYDNTVGPLMRWIKGG